MNKLRVICLFIVMFFVQSVYANNSPSKELLICVLPGHELSMGMAQPLVPFEPTDEDGPPEYQNVIATVFVNSIKIASHRLAAYGSACFPAKFNTGMFETNTLAAKFVPTVQEYYAGCNLSVSLSGEQVRHAQKIYIVDDYQPDCHYAISPQ